MKVCWQGFAGTNHSWAVCSQNICRSLSKKGHEVHLCSTNGYDYFPDDLKQLVKHDLDNDYDMQLTYTAMKNFPLYLSHGSKNKFGIWTFEFDGKNALPSGFAKFYKNCDLLLPPSNFAKQVFLNSGIPEEHIVVVPHGVDLEYIDSAEPFKLKTTKSNKILILIGQVHRRKNLPGMLDMYGKAFTKQDDVCLVIKVQDRIPTQQFELSFTEILTNFKNKYRDHAEIEIVKEYIPNIFSIYKACDIVFYATNCEGFGMISLEALALGKINITSNYGGVLDFCNNDNSLMISGKEFVVPSNYLYWASKSNTKAFMPSIEDGVEKLKFAVSHKYDLLKKSQINSLSIRSNYSWDSITDQITGLIENV